MHHKLELVESQGQWLCFGLEEGPGRGVGFGIEFRIGYINGSLYVLPRWVEPGPVPWGSVQTLPALLIEPVGLLKQTGARGSARVSSGCARAQRLLWSEGSRSWKLLPLADPSPERSWVFWVLGLAL